MGLDKLVGINLGRVEPDAAAIQRLLEAAKRNISDAHVELVSAENRFDAAYKAIMQLANAALQANGYRTLTSKPGHHIMMIQALGQTIGADKKKVMVLDALRKQRNAADYTGDPISRSTLMECVEHAETLLGEVNNWLRLNKPDFLE